MRPASSPSTAPSPADPAWVAAAGRRLQRYLRCLRCPRDRVEDFAQEALLAAVRTWSAAEPPLPWLLTTARNAWLAHCRRERPQLAIELDELHARAVHELGADGGDARVEWLVQCVERLPARSRQALDLCYRDGLPRADAAARLGLGEDGMKSLLARLRKALKACVERRSNGDA